MGGVGWLFSLMILNAALPLAILVYQNDEVGEDEISVAAWICCKIALPSTIVVFTVFYLSIKREYWRTFFSTERGKDLAMRRFLSSNEDSVKADAIFWNTRRYWEEIEDKVEKWVRSNWKRWMEEEPEWLDDSMKARIPPHMVPNKKDKVKEAEEVQRERRRYSLPGRAGKVAPDSVVKADKEIGKKDTIRENG